MSIPYLTNLGFTAVEDSESFNEKMNDPAIRVESDGGFVVTRSRYTRLPTRVIQTKFKDITNAEKAHIMSLYNAMRGGSNSFQYIHPTTGESLEVRFIEGLQFDHKGFTNHPRWDVTLKLETV